MKVFYKFILSAIIISGCTSCNYIIYTTASNSDPIVQIPVSVKEKRDLNIDVSIGGHSSEDVSLYSHQLGRSILYRKIGVSELSLGGHYAITDKLSLGLKYKIGFESDKKYTSHLIGGSANYFQNYLTKKGKAIYGYDLLGSFQYKKANNFMSVDELFINAYYLIYPYPYSGIIFFESQGQQLSYYKINQSLYRFVLQPSFTVERKYFSFNIGAAVSIQQQFQYKTVFEQDFIEYIKDTEDTNPLVYYQNKKPNVLGSVFMGMGFGPEILRLNYIFHNGWSTDKIEPTNVGLFFALTSNFNIPKKKSKELIEF
jgi:hypothetical protein